MVVWRGHPAPWGLCSGSPGQDLRNVRQGVCRPPGWALQAGEGLGPAQLGASWTFWVSHGKGLGSAMLNLPHTEHHLFRNYQLGLLIPSLAGSGFRALLLTGVLMLACCAELWVQVGPSGSPHGSARTVCGDVCTRVLAVVSHLLLSLVRRGWRATQCLPSQVPRPL